MRERYGASDRSQKLKYHTQTSGRSLHAQEMDFNDIRTTLQALMALQDQCNSLHTNAYDEAVTTPTEASVRRALAIQLIINREHGMTANENPLQGSYVMEELTDLVEEAVLQEFERLSQRGGVLGAMETLYQRTKIQEESLHYESLKHSGELPIIGVNTFENPNPQSAAQPVDLMRSSDDEKQAQLGNLHAFHAEWQRVRRADGVREVHEPRPDQRRPLRGRRSLPAVHVRLAASFPQRFRRRIQWLWSGIPSTERAGEPHECRSEADCRCRSLA
jgi:methylmalonyl-CoA mutase